MCDKKVLINRDFPCFRSQDKMLFYTALFHDCAQADAAAHKSRNIPAWHYH